MADELPTSGKAKALAFGIWPKTGLAEARAERDAARKVLARGDDPAERIKLDRIAAGVAAANSFEAVADEWLLKVEKEGRSPVPMKKLRRLLGFINATIGKRPIALISAQKLLMMLRKMEGKGRYETASDCAAPVRRCWIRHRNSACRAGGKKRPARRPHRTKAGPSRRHYGAPEGWRAAAFDQGQRQALRLLPHVFMRSGELCFAEWINIDLDKAVWTMPAYKTKMRRAHSAPLPPVARDHPLD